MALLHSGPYLGKDHLKDQIEKLFGPTVPVVSFLDGGGPFSHQHLCLVKGPAHDPTKYLEAHIVVICLSNSSVFNNTLISAAEEMFLDFWDYSQDCDY